jgi:hypothetical protein
LRTLPPRAKDFAPVDDASVLVVDDAGRRWRLPKGDAAFDVPGKLGDERVDREVCTERDLFNAHGTFYELPAENAGGFAKMRPVATHNRRIHDCCSYRGLLVMTGLAADAKGKHVVRSDVARRRCGSVRWMTCGSSARRAGRVVRGRTPP